MKEDCNNMTSREARQEIDACERKITDEYSQLIDSARRMGYDTVQQASSDTNKKTYIPLIILSVIGLITWVSGGLLFIIIGIVVAYNKHNSAFSIQKNIENQQQTLNSTLDQNHVI